VLVAFAAVVGYRACGREVRSAPAASPALDGPTTSTRGIEPTAATADGFLYGRVTASDGATYEGRLRWGGDQEAFWGDYFNGATVENPWIAQVQPPELLMKRVPIEIFGVRIGYRERRIEVGRQFMARFGEMARIERRGDEVRVTLKSGSVFDLDRFEASDFDDGLRVWDGERGVVDLDSLRIRAIELLGAKPHEAPARLYGTVHTPSGDFTGFIHWDRDEGVATDTLDGRGADGEVAIPFGTIASFARDSRDAALVTLRDGRVTELPAIGEVGDGNRGIYVDDRRYGRVQIPWVGFRRVDFGRGGSGPAYRDFPPGSPLRGSVTDHAGRRLAGRLVYDLNESETSDTLDASAHGIDYIIPFAMVASIVSPRREIAGLHARVTLHNGEELELERTGDLGDQNAGMLVFVGGDERPRYVPWAEVGQVDFERPAAMYPPLGEI
jgi:hypothetical protein